MLFKDWYFFFIPIRALCILEDSNYLYYFYVSVTDWLLASWWRFLFYACHIACHIKNARYVEMTGQVTGHCPALFVNLQSIIWKPCHDKDAYSQAQESIMSWCEALITSVSLKILKTTTPSSSAYAVRRSSTLHAETVCQVPAITMHTPLCPITSISFFTPRTTRLGTSSSG